jgi:hypothetical protein
MRIFSNRIDIKTGKEIISNWKNSKEFYESLVIDSIIEYKISIRVLFHVKGTNGHMLINGNIQFMDTPPTSVLVLDCDVLKIIIYSLMIGGSLGAITFIGMNIFVCIAASLIGSLIAYLVLINKVKRTGENFLSELIVKNSKKENYYGPKRTQ